MGTRILMAAGLAVSLAAIADPAGASTSRKVSLLRSALITDYTDVFMYPGALSTNRNIVALELGVDPFTGDGGILIGWKRLVLGVFGHRVNAFGEEAFIPEDLAEMLGLYGGGDVPVQFGLPSKIFDVLVGVDVSRDHHLGLDIGFAHSFWRQEGDSGSLTGEHTFSLGFVLGWTATRGWLRNDLSLELLWNRVRDVQADLLAARSKPSPSFTLAERLIVGEGRPLGWGLVFMLSRREYGLDIPVAGEEWDGGRWIFRIGGGPRVEVGKILTAALEVFGEADLTILSPQWSVPDDEDGGPDGWQRWNVVVPGLRVAVEVRPLKWLALRGSLEDQYRLNWQDDTGAFATSNQFTWALGLGLRWKSVAFDAAIAQELFTKGPFFLTGKESGLFSRVSVAYDW